MTTYHVATLLFLIPIASAAAQLTPAPDAPGIEPNPTLAMLPQGDNKTDPGYALYKAGYGLVLEEHWKEARAKFSDLIAKFPKSEYLDDAYYWSAYSLKHISTKQAIDAYRKFLEAYRSSPYYDDAMADSQELEYEQQTSRSVGVAVAPPAVAPVTPRPWIPASMRHMTRKLKLGLRRMTSTGWTPRPGAAPVIIGENEEEHLDEKTQLKIEALNALGQGKEDDESFGTLRDVAVNPGQPRPLREAALDALANMTKHDVLSVLLEIVRKDTSEDIPSQAIDLIGQLDIDKNRRVTTLEEVYQALPARRADDRETVVYTIASVGNDRAVDFLKAVALGDGNMELRRDAVYYLGNIGNPRSRQALQEILKEH
jgi:hypothetical protein